MWINVDGCVVVDVGVSGMGWVGCIFGWFVVWYGWCVIDVLLKDEN